MNTCLIIVTFILQRIYKYTLVSHKLQISKAILRRLKSASHILYNAYPVRLRIYLLLPNSYLEILSKHSGGQ